MAVPPPNKDNQRIMPRHELILPELGLPGRPIRLGLWLVGLGRAVTHGQPLVEILADSALVDLPSPADGILVEKCVDEDAAVEVGTVLAVVESAG